jgi:dihydroxyacid dehydratase/phosphogluconate dehydratase
MPGSVMAMGRLNRPAIMVYGGSIHSGVERRVFKHRFGILKH